MLHKAIIHVATNRALVTGANPDPHKQYPTNPKRDFYDHEPNASLTSFARFAGAVPTGRQLTELELSLCRYDWFAKNILGLEPPVVYQPELLSGADDYVDSFSKYIAGNGYKLVANFRHGFDTTSHNGFMHAMALSEGVEKLGVAVSTLSWPSHGKPLVSAYVADIANNNASVPASEQHLELDIRAAGGADKVIAVTHSLGAPLLLASLANRYHKAGGNPEKLHSIFLVSPDIDRQEFINCYADIALASAHKVYVLVSERDLPLKLSEAFREFGVDNRHARLGQAHDPPVIPGITFVNDTENDHGVLGHMLRLRTIAFILKENMGRHGIAAPFLKNTNLFTRERGGSSAYYILKRTHLW